MSDFDWQKYIEECLHSTDYCCLATVDEKGAWSNPVYFVWDEKYNLYFISQPNARHMKNIEKDSRVSLSIYSTEQDTFGDVFGMQIEGSAYFLKDREEIAQASKIYLGRRYQNRKDMPTEDEYVNNTQWIFVKVVPEAIYYFDTRFFEEERKLVPKLFYKNI